MTLTIGGVRAYNQENLYSRKSLEKFKLFIGFQNKVCTNLCISTDGFSNEIRIGSITELASKAGELFKQYNIEMQTGVEGRVEDVIQKLAQGTLTGGASPCTPGEGRGYGIEKTECDHVDEK